jgi:hypothetical protein
VDVIFYRVIFKIKKSNVYSDRVSPTPTPFPSMKNAGCVSGDVAGTFIPCPQSTVFSFGLTLSDPVSDLVRHYDFPIPDTFLDL